jgi:hypothetical protein
MAKTKEVNKVCFIRLLTGDDLIAEVTKNTAAMMVVKNAMIILNHIEMEEGRQTLVLYPWIPQGIAVGNTAKIRQDNVMLVNEIEPEILDYYKGIVEVAFASKPRVTSSSAVKGSEIESTKGQNVVSFADAASKSKKDLH